MNDWDEYEQLKARIQEMCNEDYWNAYSTDHCPVCGTRWTNRDAMRASFASGNVRLSYPDPVPVSVLDGIDRGHARRHLPEARGTSVK